MMHHLPTFGRCKRSALGAAALACYAAAIVLSPSGVRSQLTVGRREGPAAPAPRVETPLAAVVPHGDAFAPRAAADDDRPPALAAPPAFALPRLSGTSLPERNPTAATRVTAIATGTLPSAVVESGGTAHVKTVGDALDGSRITAIDATSVTLANGRRFSLEQAAAP